MLKERFEKRLEEETANNFKRQIMINQCAIMEAMVRLLLSNGSSMDGVQMLMQALKMSRDMLTRSLGGEENERV